MGLPLASFGYTMLSTVTLESDEQTRFFEDNVMNLTQTDSGKSRTLSGSGWHGGV